MSEQKTVNGVDVGELESTVQSIQGEPSLAKCKFRLSNKWVNGGHNHSVVGDFYGANQENSHLRTFELDVDEPPLLVETDLGANPVEYLLNALAGCLTTTLVYHAAIRGIKIDELESELEGDLDMQGFLGLSKDVRSGYQAIRVTFKVKTDAENIEKLKALSKLSPVFDTVSNGTEVSIEIQKK